MSNQRYVDLSVDQKAVARENICIANLCGVTQEEISTDFGVSESTIYNIKKNRNPYKTGLKRDNISDLEVAFYSQHKNLNATYLYLVFNSQNLRDIQLVDRKLHKPAYNSVNRYIFQPRINDVIEQTQLEEVLKAGKKKGGRKFLEIISKDDDTAAEALVKEFVYKRLIEAYSKSKIDFRKVFGLIIQDIRYCYFNGLILNNMDAASQLVENIKKD
ncbi:MAG: hypothetical protein ABIC04_00730 [Nanoarchaeota archaeon]